MYVLDHKRARPSASHSILQPTRREAGNAHRRQRRRSLRLRSFERLSGPYTRGFVVGVSGARNASVPKLWLVQFIFFIKRYPFFLNGCRDPSVCHHDQVVNEATLTGESVPQMKEALKPTSDPATKLQMDRQHRVNVLFSGTSLISSRRDESAKGKVPATPDGGCLAMALRTGFNSSQGELVQMIEFSQQKVSGDSKETLMALGILLVFALVRRTNMCLERFCVDCAEIRLCFTYLLLFLFCLRRVHVGDLDVGYQT